MFRLTQGVDHHELPANFGHDWPYPEEPWRIAELAVRPQEYGLYDWPNYLSAKQREKPLPWVKPDMYVMLNKSNVFNNIQWTDQVIGPESRTPINGSASRAFI